MKNLFVAGLMAALLAMGCESTPATTTTKTTQDAAASGDTAATDTATAGDTVATTDTATADTAKPDTTTVDVKKDTTPAPTKCAPTDNGCLQGCVMDACAGPAGDCTKDSKCFALNGCLSGCEKVDLPKDPTEANCYQKCITTAGAAATTKFYASQVCTGEKCITCKAGDQNCQAACASAVCLEPAFTCQSDNACAGLLNCISVNKCTDQTCLQGCITKFPDGQAGFMGFLQCYQANASSCDQ